MMRTITGIGVSSGNAVAPVVIVAPPAPLPTDEAPSTDTVADLTRIEQALSSVATALEERSARLEGDAAQMVAAAAQIARDPGLLEVASELLQEGSGPAAALDKAVESYADQFRALGGYFAERVTDLRDVGDRALAVLLGRPMPGVPDISEPSIVAAHDLAPAETAGMDPALVVGLVTSAGGRTSHTAILASQRAIPAVVQAHGILDITPGTTVAVDGDTGTVTIEPDETTIRALAERRERLMHIRSLDGPGGTADGHPVALLANIGNAADAQLAAAAGCEGVGLFRTEFVFLDATTAPTRDEQAAIYQQVLQHFPGSPVTVRTLDAGADKPLAFADLGEEPNPALGRRGLRLGRALPELVDVQLAALADAQASTGAQVKVMAPMVATLEETRWFTERTRAAGLTTAGVMVEVPSAALRAGDVLQACDFVSLGTNDLAQYTMASDRMVGELADLLDPWQPAVLDLIAITCDAAAQRGKPAGVCGESAGDPLMALVLTGLGVTSLSMSASRIPLVRWALSQHSLEQCRDLARAARAEESASGALGVVRSGAASSLTDLL